MMRRTRLWRLTRYVVRVVQIVRWTSAAYADVHRRLPGEGAEVIVSPPRFPAPYGRMRLLLAVLRVRGATCLERSLVLQAWMLARGVERDVVIGVRAGATDAFAAHAWVDGLETAPEYVEVHRLQRGAGGGAFVAAA